MSISLEKAISGITALSTPFPSRFHGTQIAHANHVVGGHGQHELEDQLLAPGEPPLAHPVDGLGPAEAFL